MVRTVRAPSPFPILETRERTNKDQGYDVDKRRDGIGDYRLRDYNRLEGSEANDFPPTETERGRGVAAKEGNRGRADGG